MNFREGTFFEVGAHDGVHLSNTYFFEKALEWRGILVEMQPQFFPSMTEKRPRSICVNSGLGPKEMQLLYLNAGDRSGLLRYYEHSGIEYLENHYQSHEPKPKFELKWVNVRPLMDILDEHKLSHINQKIELINR